MIKQFLFGGAVIESIPANVGLAILRVFAGLSMALGHGLGKLPPSEGFVTTTGDMGFPFPEFFAWVAAFSEFGGGLLLALGLLTRPGAFLICSTMLVAGFLQHAADPFSTKEMAFLYLAITGMFVFVGSGKYGVDILARNSYFMLSGR